MTAHILMTPTYIASVLRVAPATVYMWMSKSEEDDWPHEPFVAPYAKVVKGPNREESSSVWHQDQLPAIRHWYEKYTENKYSNQWNGK